MTAGELCLQPWPGNPEDMYRIQAYVTNPYDETLIRKTRPNPTHMVCVLPHNHPDPWHQAGYDTTRWNNNQPHTEHPADSTATAMAQAFTQATT